MSTERFHQFVGAVGCLVNADALSSDEMTEIKSQMRAIAAKFVDGYRLDADTGAELDGLHRMYRERCIDLGLIAPGQLFNKDDMSFNF